MATFSSGVKCFRSLIRSLRYLNGRTLSPFPTEAGHSHQSTAWINSRCPSWKALALSRLHVGSLARQTGQLTIGTVGTKNISTETNRRSILTVSADTVEAKEKLCLDGHVTNTEASNEKSGRRDRQSGSTDGGKKTSTGNWCTAKPRLGM